MAINLRVLLTGIVLVIAFIVFPVYAQETCTFEKDVVYGKGGDVDLKLDLAKPIKADKPCPGLVCVHGGAWQTGSKDGYTPFIKQMAGHGFVTAAVEYRFAPKYPWPAQIEDVKCAVRYLRAHAKELNLDPARIAAIGDSAGGHLSLMLGLTEPKDGFEGTGGYADQSSQVQAIVNLYGPTDFPEWKFTPEESTALTIVLGKSPDQLLIDLLGTADRSAPIMLKASPITYVKSNGPPILTFHGTNDPIVPIKQANLLHEALKKVGAQEKLVVVEGGSHGWLGQQLESTIRQGTEFIDSVFKIPAPEPPK